MKLRRSVRTGFAILAGVAGVAVGRLAPAVGAQQTAPAMWVPVTADYQELSSRAVERVGHYWRDQNGSVRVETGRSYQTLDVINIRNAGSGEVYEFRTDLGWFSAPWSGGASIASVREISANGGTVTTVTVEGRTAVRCTLADGGVEVYIPELNFLLVERTAVDGPRQLLRNVRVPAQIAATLFAPPQGEHVARRLSSPVTKEVISGAELSDLPQ
jgi:hypothetical protein